MCGILSLIGEKQGGGKAELFLKNPKNYFEGFLSGASRISRVWGRHSPTRFPQGQNERKANFGTSVESCSEKLPLSSATDFAAIYKGRCGCFRQYSDCSGSFCPLWFCFLLRTETENAKRIFTFFITTTVAPCRSAKSGAIFLGQTTPSPPTTTGMFGLPKIGAIKEQIFSDLLLALLIVGYCLFVFASGSLCVVIFNCFTLISVSCLHFGQYSGKFLSSVSSRIFSRVLFLQTGHKIKLVVFTFYIPPAIY